MRRTLWIIGLIAPALIGVRAIAGGEAPSPPEVILLQKCTIDYRHSTLVGSNQNIGRIQECLIRAGDQVKGGQVLGRLFNKDVLAELESRTVALESSETTIHQGEATLEVERTKLRRTEALYNRNSLLTMSIQDLQLQRYAVKTAELGLQAAIQSRRMAETQLHAAEAMVAAREIVSPHDGVIVEVYKNVGEAITFGMPIYKVVAIDRMRVTGYLDAGDAWHVRQGQAVRIMPELEGGDLPIEREIFEGKITFVDSEIDPKTRTCRVFAEVENRDGLLRSGLECRMEISPSAASGVVLPSARSRPGPDLKNEIH